MILILNAATIMKKQIKMITELKNINFAIKVNI